MDNIVILSGNSDADERLITSLRVLFPECKIQPLSSPTENLEKVSACAEPAYGDNASATFSVSQNKA